MELTEAYRECERITWSAARNFAYGIRLLPPDKRRGLAVIYAFARRIDDIGDGTMPAGEKIAALEVARQQIADLTRPPADDPVLLALADVERSFPVPIPAFGELIDGCVADVRGTGYQTFDDLLWYCRCVAGSIGRLSLGIFGTSHDMDQAAELADSLGVALQLTNILRDIREDYGNGRVYLPAEDLAKFDCDLGQPEPPGFARLVEFEAERARDWYATGWKLLAMLDRRSAGLHRRDGRHLPRPARPHRRRPGRGPARPGLPVRPAEGHGRGQGPGREARVSPRVAVIGGGLAGITAAIALAEAGAAVTLLEARPRLGGATCSFARDGLIVDTGQHIYLGCCTAYRGLLDKLGMTAHAPLQDRFDVTVLAPGADPQAPRRGRLRRTALPGPLHMLPALGRYPFLSLAERASVARPALAMRRVDPDDPRVDEQRFGDWLAAHGQSDRARRALWDLFTVSALNIAGDDASLSLAATVVRTGLLGRSNAADIGVPALPLGELHGDAGAAAAARLGAQILLGAKVTAIEVAPAPASSDPPRRLHRRPGPPFPRAPRPPRGPRRPRHRELGRHRELRRRRSDRDRRRRGGPGRAARGRRPPGAAGCAAGRDRRGLGRPGRLAHRQRARDLRPPGDGPALRRRRRLAGPVGLRPHTHLRPGPRTLIPPRSVPGHLAVGRG